MMAQQPDHHEETPTLAEALNFTDDDLAANRAGNLAEPQRARLRTRSIVSVGGNALLTLGLAAIGLWVVTLGYLLVAGALFALAAGLFWLGRTGNAQLDAERNAGAVASVRGEAHLSADEYPNPNGTVTEFVLSIGDEAFVLPRHIFAAFEDGTHYAVYYLPKARLVLSAEEIDERAG